MSIVSPLFSESRAERLTFTGQGHEYFRIWIINLALSVVTLGVYSAWAKVRRQQYFFRHTHLAGSSFNYHGDPLAILKGRIVAVGLLAAYFASGLFGPLATLAAMAALAIVMPWLMARSLRFQLWNTSYRGVRFRFLGGVGAAYRIVVGLGLLVLVTFGLAVPLWYHRLKRYQHGHAAYGRLPFQFTASAGDFYRVFIGVGIAVLIAGLFAAIASIGVAGVGALLGLAPSEDVDPTAFQLAMQSILLLGGLALYICFVLAIRRVLAVQLSNLVWSHTTVGTHQIEYDLELFAVLRVELTNLVLTVVTLGLYLPFAQIRRAHYTTQALSIQMTGEFDDVENVEGHEPGAAGQEVAGIFDLDIAF